MRQRVVAIFVLASLTLYLHAQSQGPDRTIHSFNIEKEAALGAQLALQIRRQTTPLGINRVDNYVEGLGRQLAAQMPNAPENWNFTVIRDPRGGSLHEPLSLSGGYIFVPAQLIPAAENEAEFAGMLAHSVAHVAERQWIHQAPDQ